jgi:hypothetical protein
MAQPMEPNAPSFCLSVFGTNNKFSADTVLARWKTITDVLKQQNIEILGVSSDGDSRLLKAMKIASGLSVTSQC